MVLKYCLDTTGHKHSFKRNSYHNVISNWDCIQISHNKAEPQKGEFMEMASTLKIKMQNRINCKKFTKLKLSVSKNEGIELNNPI